MRTLIVLGLLLAVTPAHADQARGVNIHAGFGPSIGILSDMGADWVRVSLNWADVERAPNQYDFDYADLMLTDLKARGMKVLYILAYAPPFWSSNGQTNGRADKDAWVRYVDAITKRFADKVDVWEIWNEPNLGVFWQGNVWQYIDTILKPAAPVIRSNAPGSRIAAPGITHILEAWPDLWMLQLNWFGALDTFDIVSYHLYYRSNVASFKKAMSESSFLHPSVRKVIEGAGMGNKPIWITEYGCDLGETLNDEQRRADCVVGMTQAMHEMTWVDGWFTYAMADGGWALLYPDGTPRPVVGALKQLYSSWR